jgi:hypothetical protein
MLVMVHEEDLLDIDSWLCWFSFTVKLVSKIMSLSGMCCVVHPSVLLSMLLLVEASLAFMMYLLK